MRTFFRRVYTIHTNPDEYQNHITVLSGPGPLCWDVDIVSEPHIWNPQNTMGTKYTARWEPGRAFSNRFGPSDAWAPPSGALSPHFIRISAKPTETTCEGVNAVVICFGLNRFTSQETSTSRTSTSPSHRKILFVHEYPDGQRLGRSRCLPLNRS